MADSDEPWVRKVVDIDVIFAEVCRERHIEPTPELRERFEGFSTKKVSKFWRERVSEFLDSKAAPKGQIHISGKAKP